MALSNFKARLEEVKIDDKSKLLYEYLDIFLDTVKFRMISLEDVESELAFAAK